MYKILIVEDEELVRKSIVNKIDWKTIGFSEVFDAEDGAVGLELALKIKPDVLLTDIAMPFMDGLELSEKLLKELPNTKIIIISGYDEFEYARKAIDLGVNNYVLKPIISSRLTEYLTKIKNQLDEKNLENSKLLQIKRQITETLPLLKEKFFNSLIKQGISEEEISSDLKNLNINFIGNLFIVCVLEIDSLNDLISKCESNYISALNIDLLKIISDSIGNFGFVFNDALNRKVIIYSIEDYKSKIFEMEIYDSLLSIKNTIKNNLHITVTIGIGTLVSQLKNLKTSYNEALNALEHKFLMGENNIYSINNKTNETLSFYFPFKKIDDLLFKVKFESLERVKISFDSFFADLINFSNISSENIKLIMFELMNQIQKLLLDLEDKKSANHTLYLNIYREINVCETLDDVKRLLWKYVEYTYSDMHIVGNNRNLQTVEKAKKFINENYWNPDLSLDTVANFVSVSSCYLSIIFKKENNETFIEYVTKLRMEKAKELLIVNNLKPSEVAFKIGFRDPHYFSICFKKHIGFSPSEFKNAK
ncbi:response regulator [Clostridium thailandense]|uniref:response regulator transcription factor n=1 Tax=Clostridium thailandense TaxID=2794346 RepID=UPI003988B00D